jgi:hypothetical protein
MTSEVSSLMRMRKLVFGILFVVVGIALLVPMRVDVEKRRSPDRATPMDLSPFSKEAPKSSLRLLFIHHSCGGQLLASLGESLEKASCIYISHPDGGCLRDKLAAQGYEVHEASYGSEIGEKTDMFDWVPKFRKEMKRILVTDFNDQQYSDTRSNRIVVFKSCYTANRFLPSLGGAGDEAGPDLTVENSMASFRALLPLFQAQPETLFVYLTSPPLSPYGYKESYGKQILKKILGRPLATERAYEQARQARRFANWAVSKNGWLKDYPLRNVVVFDYYDTLAGHGASNLLNYTKTADGDSHPSRAGNETVASEFVTFLNQAVDRIGLGR